MTSNLKQSDPVRYMVLIVDDEPTNISVLAQSLEKTYDIRVARSAEQAFEILKSGLIPDFLLLDVIMPGGMSGLEACRILKRDPHVKHIPIIFITAQDSIDNEIEGLEAGAIDYISKPFNLALVQHRLKVHLQQAVIEKKLRQNELEIKEQQEALQKAEEQSRLLLETVGEGIIGVDLLGHVTFVNSTATKLLASPKDKLLGKHIHSTIHQRTDDNSIHTVDNCPILSALATGRVTRGDDQVFRRSGGVTFPVEYSSAPILHDGEITGAVVSFKNIANRLKAASEMLLAQAVFENIREGIVVTGPDGVVQRVNPLVETITGYAVKEIVGQKIGFWKSGRHDAAFYKQMWQTLQETGHWSGEIWNRKKEGSIYPTHQTISCIENGTGKPQFFVSLLSDISQKKAQEEALARQANYDLLTSLPNRNLFHDRLGRALLHSKRLQTAFALLFIDLDKFKIVNDTMGHQAGDQLLQLVAEGIHSTVRESDTVARLGGDEFTVLLSGIKQKENAITIAEKILHVLRQPFQLDDGIASIGGSIGIVCYPQDAVSQEELLKKADMAMYKAKQEGRNRYCLFTKEDYTDQLSSMSEVELSDR